MNARLYFLQRLTAMIMLPLVIIHIGVMIWAINDGLTAEEILSRTQGSIFWALIYGLFVLAVAIHGSIGFRTISREWFKFSKTMANIASILLLAVLIVMGLKAVYSVVAI